MPQDDTEDVARRIEAMIRERFDVRPDDAGFTRRANLWEEGYVDSTGVVEVIGFLESTFDVRIPEEVLFSPEFTTVDGMANWIATLRGRARAAATGTDG